MSNSASWPRAPLGDLIELKRGYDLPTSSRQPGPYPVVSSSGSTGSHAEAKVRGPGVVTGRYGTIGQVFYVDGDFWPLNTTLYVRDFKGNDPRFVSYFLRTLDFLQFSDKAAVPGVNRNHIHEALVRFPPIEEQRAIASVLGALDDKIELNRRMNETLEALARAIFTSWFVDFDPVRAKAEGRQPARMDAETAALFPDSFEDSPLGPIPSGWGVRSVDAIADFLNGLALQRYPPTRTGDLPVIKIPELRVGVTPKTGHASAQVPSQYVVGDGDVLFSWSGSLVAVLWTGGRGALNQHLFRVTSDSHPRWLYYFWILEHLPTFRRIAAGKATTMGHIQRGHLAQAMCVVPSRELVERTTAVLEPLLDSVVARGVEPRSLVAIRDTLLPKLVSGDVRLDFRRTG